MPEYPAAPRVECFSDLPEPRVERTREHKLIDIVVIAVCAVVGGAEGWTDVEAFGCAQLAWFKSFLELPNGIPSHDTFGRVFARLSPSAFEQAFVRWTQALSETLPEDVVALDGKTPRRSYDRTQGKTAIHLVSAWAAANRLVLGQVKTQDRSNEITALPELLKLLDIRGCIVTIDALGTQKSIAANLIEGGANYVLALKGNQDHLHHDVRNRFERAQETDFQDRPHDRHETVEKGHGRIEHRRYWTIPAPSWLLDFHSDWARLSTLGMVQSERPLGEKVTRETRYDRLSLSSDAKRFAHAVRSHWGVENPVHWVLDVVFREDDSRVRVGNAPANRLLLRRIAMNLLRQEPSKLSLKAKRKKAGWDLNYLTKVLTC
jgi:predicted transposase YbfD/YdcC